MIEANVDISSVINMTENYISISKLKLTIMYIKNFINTSITEIILG